jgi:trehalose 6-phosphate synthase/phosphatase
MRTLIVSNRLPVTVERTRDGLRTSLSAGGLATGLCGVHQRDESWWIGCAGELADEPAESWREVERDLRTRRLQPVALTRKEHVGYYERIANGVLWPLFHYLPERVPLDITDWATYEAVNARFAAAVAEMFRPGDRIWVHDYQLMLVPEMLRGRLREAPIGFFLHIPFPASEVFRILPFRARLLQGLLGADLIGFHTAAYARHFTASVLRLLGLAARVDRVQTEDREVRVGVFPMGIDAARWGQLAAEPEAARKAAKLREDPQCSLLVGIDRLDYTKGIPRRLLAFERLLATHPELHERVRLVQLAVPSRTGVTAYREFRTRIESLVSRVNGHFGTPRWVPVHYLHRSLSQSDVVSLYRAADVMVVTPVRDGMNLVAKEFVACRADEDGVLVLSEFTGAAAELAEALYVNPYDIEQTAATLYRAVTLAEDERRDRMRALRRRVFSYDVERWARSFLSALDEANASSRPATAAMSGPEALEAAAETLRAAPTLLILLDYDGTLVPFASVPTLAAPDADLLQLLTRLAERTATTVHVVSGRPRESLDRWLGSAPVWLHAEHGFWSRAPGGSWEEAPRPDLGWMERVRPILEDFHARTPGSLIEQKTAALAWHYRMADPEFGAHQANELRVHLRELLSNEPVEILPGEKVIELRPHGVHKGRIVEQALRVTPPGATVLAIGDDCTDEDMFAAVPADGTTIHVGPAASRAILRLRDWRATREFLRRLLADPGEKKEQ